MSAVRTEAIIITTTTGLPRHHSVPKTAADAMSASHALQQVPGKRRRLTHLTPEEKVMRRKLKNRVAAQTARDRKKALMSDMELAIAKLKEKNKRLIDENSSLQAKSGALVKENCRLKEQLGLTVADSCMPIKTQSGLPRSAAPAVPLQKAQVLTESLWMMHSNYFALLLSLFSLLEEIDGDMHQQYESHRPKDTSSSCGQEAKPINAMVGPTAAELESINELIKFDHIYFKEEPSEKAYTHTSLSFGSSLLNNSKDIFVEDSSCMPMLVSQKSETEIASCELDVQDVCMDKVTDSGFSSDCSDAPSTYCSDLASPLGENSFEESFMELFPDLL